MPEVDHAPCLARQDLRERLFVALVEQRVIDSQQYGEAPYAPITWADVDAALPPREDRIPAPTSDAPAPETEDTEDAEGAVDAEALTLAILRYYGYTDADIAEAEQVHPGRVCSDDCYGEDGKTTHPPAYAGLGGTAAMVVEVVLPWMAARAGGVTAPGHGGTNPGAEQSALRRAQREAADWLHGADRPAGHDCRFSNPVGLVRALIREAEARIASNL